MGTATLFLSATIFSFFGFFAQYLSGKSSLTLTLFILYFGGIGLLLFYILFKKHKYNFNLKNLFQLVGFGIISVFPILFFNLAVSSEKIGLVVLTQNSVTLFASYLTSIFFLKEKADLKIIGLLTIILLGITTIYLPINIANFQGFIFSTLVGFSNFIVNYFRKKLSSDLDSTILALSRAIFGSIIFGFLLFSSKEKIVFQPEFMVILILFLYTVLNNLTALFLNIGFSKINFTLGNAILTLEIPFGFFLGYMLAGQILILHQISGSLIVTIAIFIIKLIDIENQYKSK